ncbi:MAG: hypothetical protein ACI9HK_005648 [Pirellulaceae bacterium]|jgi:hypothetical protein
MRGILASIPFALITVVCWGSYGPVLHHGKAGMSNNSWAQLLCVGISYFVIAVIVPIIVLKKSGEQGNWTISGIRWGLSAGAAGALGALGIITALSMPIVFGCAPVVNTLVSMYMGKMFGQMSPGFMLGIILVAVGAAGVFYYKPKPAVPPVVLKASQAGAEGETAADKSPSESVDHAKDAKKVGEAKKINITLIAGGILLTVICWGAYGSILHKSQALMAGSRLRPLLCVGLAYFVIAVIVPVGMMSQQGFPEVTTFNGWSFSLLAGVCGAIGALGIIMSFTFGGKPVFVMPLVFGGAPVVNTAISLLEMGEVGAVHPIFYGSLATVIIGAIVTLVTAPKPQKKAPAKDDATETSDADAVSKKDK